MNLFAWLSPILAVVVAKLVARWHRNRVATSGRFTPEGEEMNINPGQTATATIKALAGSVEVPHGPVTFNPPPPGITMEADDTTASYTVASTTSPGAYGITASFLNSLGVSIPVNGTLTVVAAADVATSGEFVFGTPTGP